MLDLLLDFLFLDVMHIEIRFCTILSIYISNIALLVFRNTSYAATAGITFTTWSYFIGFCCIQILSHYWLPEFFPAWKLRILIIIHFMYSSLNLWNSIFAETAFEFTILHYVLFAVIVLVMGHCFNPWMIKLLKSYRESRMDFISWLNSLSINESCALALKFAALCVIFGRTILLILAPNFPNTPNITLKVWICLEIIRNVSALLTYTIPSRICRASAIRSERMIGLKTEFIKYISHELRSPMGVISSCLELLKRLPLGEAQAEHVNDIQMSSSIVIDILDDLLLYERIEREEIEMNLKLVNAYSLFRRIKDEYKHPAITLHSETGTESDLIRADRAKIRMIMNAFIGPALRDPDGRVEISLDSREMLGTHASEKYSSRSSVNPFLTRSRISPYLAEGSKQCVVSIRCHSKGNAAGQKRGLGNRQFSRVGRDDHDASAFKLWIAQQLIRLHGADITLEEDCPLEMQYIIAFPCASGNEPVEESCQSQMSHALVSKRHRESLMSKSAHLDEGGVEESAGIYSPSRRTTQEAASASLNILIVDDSSMVRKMTAKLLASLAHNCDVAYDGDHAVLKVRESLQIGVDYDVILMDNQMPSMMGFEATKLIRQSGFLGIILGVTGNALDSDIQQFLNSGADDVIVKPLTKENFGKSLRAHIAKRYRCEGI